MTKKLDDLAITRRKWERAEKKCEDLRKLEAEAFQKLLPNLLKNLKAAKKRKEAGCWTSF